MSAGGGIVLYGAAYSVYVRAVRLVLEEKGLAYRLEEIDIFAPETLSSGYLERHPFGRIPAFAHDGLALYESDAILRYLEERFPDPALLPRGIAARAKANQMLAVLNNYAYRTLVWEVYVQRIEIPSQGGSADAARIERALAAARTCLAALSALAEQAGEGPYLLGAAPQLPDLLAYPMLRLFRIAPEGAALLEQFPRLAAGHAALADRASAVATRFPLETPPS